ncbi:MAG: hypothetical protein A2144_12690 [Chloroflexi bacterium RBG_16_50_9]|nr:MAG: hypothetical protein A2144_12690 [Chloroflexi bacterium RBG_16_50_9]
MKLNKLVSTAIKVIHAVVRGFTFVTTGAMFVMVVVMVINVLGRFIFRHPLQGTIELVEVLMVMVAYSVLAYTELKRGHIHVELLVIRFPRKVQTVLASIMCFVGAAFFITNCWQATELARSNLVPLLIVTDIFSIPFTVFILVMAFGYMLLGLEMLINGFHPLPSGNAKKVKESNA